MVSYECQIYPGWRIGEQLSKQLYTSSESIPKNGNYFDFRIRTIPEFYLDNVDKKYKISVTPKEKTHARPKSRKKYGRPAEKAFAMCLRKVVCWAS